MKSRESLLKELHKLEKYASYSIDDRGKLKKPDRSYSKKKIEDEIKGYNDIHDNEIITENIGIIEDNKEQISVLQRLLQDEYHSLEEFYPKKLAGEKDYESDYRR
jgi:hypothetical protein